MRRLLAARICSSVSSSYCVVFIPRIISVGPGRGRERPGSKSVETLFAEMYVLQALPCSQLAIVHDEPALCFLCPHNRRHPGPLPIQEPPPEFFVVRNAR